MGSVAARARYTGVETAARCQGSCARHECSSPDSESEVKNTLKLNVSEIECRGEITYVELKVNLGETQVKLAVTCCNLKVDIAGIESCVSLHSMSTNTCGRPVQRRCGTSLLTVDVVQHCRGRPYRQGCIAMVV